MRDLWLFLENLMHRFNCKVMIEDLQKEIDTENDVDSVSDISDEFLPEKKRDKRQNQNSELYSLFGLNLLPFLKPQTRPRRKPQQSGNC